MTITTYGKKNSGTLRSSKIAFIYSLLALAAGAMLTLAFAPFNWYPIAFISPAVLLYAWLHSTTWQAFWRGWLFGIGLFATGATWVYISIHVYGNANTIIAGLITVLFVILTGIFPATLGLIFTWLAKRSSLATQCLCIFPATWVVWEWLRSWVFTGFPWLFLGYSQISSNLRGYAPLFGVYGLSLLTTFISGCLILLVSSKSRSIKIVSIALIIILLSVGAGATIVKWTQPIGKMLRISLVQGNISQDLKWNMNYLANIMRIYLYETEQHQNSDIIVWPEAAIPAYPQQIPFYFDELAKKAKKHDITQILGVLTVNPTTQQFYNSMLMLGNGTGAYRKRKLVPFGEYVPLKKLFTPLMNYINIPMSSFTAGPKHQSPLIVSGVTIAPFICYEIAYPIMALSTVSDKQLIVVISDDSWFGNSIASAQQLQMAQMRALETGRYILYSNNTGITAIIGPQGSLLKVAPVNVLTVLSGTVHAMSGETQLMRWNYYPVLAIIILFIVLAFVF